MGYKVAGLLLTEAHQMILASHFLKAPAVDEAEAYCVVDNTIREHGKWFVIVNHKENGQLVSELLLVMVEGEFPDEHRGEKFTEWPQTDVGPRARRWVEDHNDGRIDASELEWVTVMLD